MMKREPLINPDDLDQRGWDEYNRDISEHRSHFLYIHPFKEPYAKGVEEQYSRPTFYTFARYLVEIDNLLPWEFVIAECFKFGIAKVGTRPPGGWSGRGWTQDQWGYMSKGEFGITINLNPHLGRKKVAEEIRAAYGVDIFPREIYYWIWFHEVGHAFSDKTKEYFQKYWDWGLRMGPATSQEDVFSAKKEAEREAVAFARRRFEQWRKAKGRLSIKKLIETLRPMLNQAAES